MMEPPDQWTALLANLYQCQKEPLEQWKFLVWQGLVVDTPGNRDAFVLWSRFAEQSAIESDISYGSLMSDILDKAAGGIILPEATIIDPHGETALRKLQLYEESIGEFDEISPTGIGFQGRMIGEYLIGERLKWNDLNAIYQAHDHVQHRKVTLKIFQNGVAKQADFRQRFFDICSAASRLHHPSIAEVLDYQEIEGTYFVATEFLPGETLDQFLFWLALRDKWIPVHEAIQVVNQIGEAADDVYRQARVLLDITPTRIKFKPKEAKPEQWRAVVDDAGIDRALRTMWYDTWRRENKSRIAPWHPRFMQSGIISPEEFSESPVGPASNVYRLGILLYELTVGRHPFHIRNPDDEYYPPKREVIPPRLQRPDLPIALEEVILRSLMNEPSQRFATVGEMLQALQAIPLEELPDSAPPTAPLGLISLKELIGLDLAAERQAYLISPVQKPDRIQIYWLNGTRSTVLVPERAFTLGSGPECDIVVQGSRIAERHWRLELQGDRYIITDLGNAGNTSRANTSPDSDVWIPGDVKRIGSIMFRLRSDRLESLRRDREQENSRFR